MWERIRENIFPEAPKYLRGMVGTAGGGSRATCGAKGAIRVVEETCEKITWPGTDEKHVLWEERQVPNGGDKPIKVKMTRVGS